MYGSHDCILAQVFHHQQWPVQSQHHCQPQPLRVFLQALAERMGKNFYSIQLFLGAGTLVLNYQQFIKKLHYCPIPVAFGKSGTGKTTELECAMALLGARECRLYSKAT